MFKKFLLVFLLLISISLAVPVQAATNGRLTADGTAVVVNKGYRATGIASTLYLSGSFGGGTVTVEASPDEGTTWVSVPNYSWTSATVVNLTFQWTGLRIRLSGATSPSIYWWVL